MPTVNQLHREDLKDPEYRRAWAEDTLMTRTAVNLARYRSERGLTQEQLAEKLERTASFVAHLEAGDKNLTLRTLARFAHALEIDPVDLLQPLASEVEAEELVEA